MMPQHQWTRRRILLFEDNRHLSTDDPYLSDRQPSQLEGLEYAHSKMGAGRLTARSDLGMNSAFTPAAINHWWIL